jgi:glycosyltransferase involved in cell wall biosynthesis
VTTAPRLFMTADAVGGVWFYTMDLCRGLAQTGVQISLAVTGPDPSPAQAREAIAIPGLRLLPTSLPLDWAAEQPEAVLEAGASLASLARSEAASLVHLNSAAYAAGGAFRQPLVIVCHSCVASWWEAVRQAPLPADFVWRRDQVAAAYALADRLIAPSAAFATTTARLYGIPLTQVVHNGRSPEKPSPTSDAMTLPAKFVFAAGRLWDEGKNLAALDRAAPLLEVPILVAGPRSGPHGAAIDLPNLRLLGSLDAAAMAHCFGAASLFVAPAHYEPFGLTVLEAAQAGCPLLLADIASFRELWGDAADYLPDDGAASIATAIRRLLADPALLRWRGAAARARAARYDVPRMVEATQALYRTLQQEIFT